MIPNVYTFDAGISAWAHKYPSATLLLGKELINPQTELISEKRLHQKTVDFETFKKMAASDDTVVIDARDPLQRKQKLPGIKKDLHVAMDKLVKNIVKKGHMKDKQLYI